MTNINDIERINRLVKAHAGPTTREAWQRLLPRLEAHPAPVAVPAYCRERDKAAGKIYPRYFCEGCGEGAPRAADCAAALAHPAPVAVPEGWRVMWFTGSFGSERWEIYDPEGNGGAVDKADVRDDMARGLLDALAAAKGGKP